MLYLISGLGADERVFQFLDLPIEKKFIQWVKPQKNEDLADYCRRLISQIDLRQEINLIGISFGGIVAQEIAKLVPCKKVIIISSVKSSAEFSWQLKLVRQTKIHLIVPLWFLQISNKITADYYFGVKEHSESKLLHQIIADTDPEFLAWAIGRIMCWKSNAYPSNLIHIHGTNDKIFPIQYIKHAIEIPNGGHFMIVNKATVISSIIFDYLKANQNGHSKS